VLKNHTHAYVRTLQQERVRMCVCARHIHTQRWVHERERTIAPARIGQRMSRQNANGLTHRTVELAPANSRNSEKSLI